MPSGQRVRIPGRAGEPRENRGSENPHKYWILYQRTDWQKSEGNMDSASLTTGRKRGRKGRFGRSNGAKKG